MDQMFALALQQAASGPMFMSGQTLMSMPMPLSINFSGGVGHGQRFGFDQYLPTGSPGNEADDDEEDDEEQRTLFCGNLDERVSEEILYEVFLQAGPIETVRIPVDNTGKQRNFGFITYQHLSAVPFALDLYQGLELYQKKVTIKQQGGDKPKNRQMHGRNPFGQELLNQHQNAGGANRHVRHSLHETKPYDRHNDLRRRSDSAVMDRNRPRVQHQQQQHQQQHQYHTGNNRRSEQRNQGKRRI